MQQLQPSAANQSHNPPTRSMGHLSSHHSVKRIGLILFGSLLLLISAMAVSEFDRKRPIIDMQAVTNTHPNTDTGAQITNTPNIKSIGTDPPPESSKVSVNVNGQNVPVPPQGDTSQKIISGNTETNVEVTRSSSNTGDSSEGSASSSNNLDVSVTSNSDLSSSSSSH